MLWDVQDTEKGKGIIGYCTKLYIIPLTVNILLLPFYQKLFLLDVVELG